MTLATANHPLRPISARYRKTAVDPRRFAGRETLVAHNGAESAGRDIEYFNQLSGGAASAHSPDCSAARALLLALLGACVIA